MNFGSLECTASVNVLLEIIEERSSAHSWSRVWLIGKETLVQYIQLIHTCIHTYRKYPIDFLLVIVISMQPPRPTLKLRSQVHLGLSFSFEPLFSRMIAIPSPTASCSLYTTASATRSWIILWPRIKWKPVLPLLRSYTPFSASAPRLWPGRWSRPWVKTRRCTRTRWITSASSWLESSLAVCPSFSFWFLSCTSGTRCCICLWSLKCWRHRPSTTDSPVLMGWTWVPSESPIPASSPRLSSSSLTSPLFGSSWISRIEVQWTSRNGGSRKDQQSFCCFMADLH